MITPDDISLGREPQFDSAQQQRALELIESLDWEDIDRHLRFLEQTLGRALEASAEDFGAWEEHADVDWGFEDEMSLSRDDVAGMSPAQHRAYVARLIRTVVLVYSCPQGPLVVPGSNSMAALLSGLNDIRWMASN